MNDRDLHPLLPRLQRPALIAAAAGLIVLILGLIINPTQFFLSWLLAFLFVLSFPLGALAILMLQHLSGGRWGLVLRRLLESATKTIPLMALLFLPLLFGLGRLYIWKDNLDARGQNSSPLRLHYLTPTFFTLRAILYFALWIALAFILNNWSRREDESPDPRLIRRFQLLSSAGLLIYCATMTFASIDWVMSLDPHWYSTIFGLIFIVGQGLAALALLTALLSVLSKESPLDRITSPDHFHDLGNLLLAFTMLWAYMQFSQYLIIWSGNVADETPFYIYRTRHGWQAIAIILIIFHFFIPFILLLNRRTKRSPQILAYVCLAIVIMRFIDLFWIVVPHHAQGHHQEPPLPIPHWLDLAALLFIGGLWTAFFIHHLRKTPLVPQNDYRLLEEVAAHA